ncbi:MAG TPA: hypothetical protein VG096_02825 [Bryobacteraceae bacterium]|jgi:hypothetical protein|nr:hypothetical protein [Bryobacteraceae bacterium]
MKLACFRSVCVCAILALELGAIHGQPVPAAAPAAPPASEASHPTVALAPAVVMLHGKPGQSATQTLTISNQLPVALRFEIEAQDVVVREGKRVFVPAGQIPLGIAAQVVAAPASVVAPAGQSASVNVTLTAPLDTSQRAIVVFFKAKVADPEKETLGFAASLGALITLNLTDAVRVVSGPMAITPQTASANVTLSEELENTGAEPVVPKGAVAILDQRGKRVAKATFDPRRLLPGEKGTFSVSSPTLLSPGHYRTLSSFEYEGKVLTNAGEFTVSE